MRKYGPKKRLMGEARTKPAGVWLALATGLVVTVGLFVGVLIPLVGLVTSVAGIGPVAVVPMASVLLKVALGYFVAFLALLAILRVRRTSFAWLLSACSMIAAFLASIYPLVGAAFSIADRVGGLMPAVGELWELVQRSLGR